MKKLSFSKTLYLSIVALCMASTSTIQAQDENKLSADLSADIVSSYVWRGSRGAGASIQPSLGVSYSNLTLGAWASTDLEDKYKEVDFSLSYAKGGFSATVTDYWWDGNGVFNYFGGTYGHASHSLEGTLAYTLPESFPLSVSWNTFFVGQYDRDAAGDNTYSTYIELAYPFKVGPLDMGVAVGLTPWESAVYGTDGFKFTNVQLSASKEVKINDKFSVPVFASVVANPYTEDINFVFGITIK